MWACTGNNFSCYQIIDKDPRFFIAKASGATYSIFTNNSDHLRTLTITLIPPRIGESKNESRSVTPFISFKKRFKRK